MTLSPDNGTAVKVSGDSQVAVVADDDAVGVVGVEGRVTVVSGNGEVTTRPAPPFDAAVCDFLADLSRRLKQSKEAAAYPELAALSFWCRAANIKRLKKNLKDASRRLGLGMVFHVAPGNVPVSFAYSYVFGLLAGNANVVRLPSTPTPEESVFFDVLDDALGDHQAIRPMTSFIRYSRDDKITAGISGQCDARVVWGGDATIADVRRIPLPVRAFDIAFADRYSLCVLNDTAVAALDRRALGRLAEQFYNDTYLMDQNACSSPHLVLWLGGYGEGSKRFWAELSDIVAARYELAHAHAVDKHAHLLATLIKLTEAPHVEMHGNRIYRLVLSNLPQGLDELRGRFGIFFEYATDDLDEIAPLVSKKFQTLTYFGVDKLRLHEFVLTNRLKGIDRIVPVGSALNIDVEWDGINVLQTLSRLVSTH